MLSSVAAMIRLACVLLSISMTTAWDPVSDRLGRRLLKQLRSLEESSAEVPLCEAMGKALACNGKSQGTCNGDCEWKTDENKCDLSGAAAAQMMLGGGDNNPMADLMQKSMACNVNEEGTCKGDCQWNTDEKKCDLNPAVAMQAMFVGGDNNPMADFMQKSMACNGNEEGTCNGDCQWNTGEKKCDVNPLVAMQAMLGGGGNNSMAELMQKSIACNGNEEGTCNGECEWKPVESTCDISGAAGMQMMLGGGGTNAMADVMQKSAACERKTEQVSCSGDCKWHADDTDTKCKLDDMVVMQTMMGGGENSVLTKSRSMADDCNKKGQAACESKPCRWVDAESKCDLDPQAAFSELCEGVAISGASGASVATLALASLAAFALALSL